MFSNYLFVLANYHKFDLILYSVCVYCILSYIVLIVHIVCICYFGL